LAKLKRKRLRDFISKAARSLNMIWTTKSFLSNPIKTSAKIALKKAESLGNYRKIKGVYRNRVQYLNPRNKRWVIIDTNRRKIIRVKKTPGPAKNIRKITRKPQKRSGKRSSRGK